MAELIITSNKYPITSITMFAKLIKKHCQPILNKILL